MELPESRSMRGRQKRWMRFLHRIWSCRRAVQREDVTNSRQPLLQREDVTNSGQPLLPGLPDDVTLNLIASRLPWSAFHTLSGVGQALLPGLPDDVTLNMIASKLPWSAFHTLSSVSGAWRRAIRNREVYDVRVGSRSTETLACFSCSYTRSHVGGVGGIALYSMRDASCSVLPPIPSYLSGAPGDCQTISLDGKLYILGGVGRYFLGPWAGSPFGGTDEVYVCDLAGQGRGQGPRQWKRCASMKQGRLEFGCGVLNGKIYVFGGLSNFHIISASEVYDPKEDSSSSVKPMADPRFGHVVETVGEEFVVVGGFFGHLPDHLIPRSKRFPEYFQIERAKVTEVYHPAENKWRVGKLVANGCVGGCTTWCVKKCSRKLFMARGKLYSIGLDAIHIHNAPSIRYSTRPWNNAEEEEDAWTLLHTFSLMSSFSSIVEQWDIQVVDDELVIRFFSMDNAIGYERCRLAQSKGFGRERKELVWEKVDLSLPLANMIRRNGRMCTIQL